MVPSWCQGISRTENMDSMFAGMTIPFGWIASVRIWPSAPVGITPQGSGPHAFRALIAGLEVSGGRVQRSAAPGVGAVVAFAPGGGDAIRLLLAAGRAGAARLECFAD